MANMRSERYRFNEVTGLKLIFRAFRYRNYRLFFGGQVISLMGTWMQRMALSWLVYRMTNSAFLLGMVEFCGQIPIFLLAPFAGVVIDKWSRHRTLVGTQILAMIQASVLTVLVLTGTIKIWQIIFLRAFLGFVDAFDMPARQSFVVEMVEKKENLGNAIALNSSMVNAARLLGPSIAGIVIVAVGEGMCFLINAISYLAVIASLLSMRIIPRVTKAKSNDVFQGLKEGFVYVFGFAPIKSIILLLALFSVMGFPYNILMPIFAKDVLHGGADTLGFLMGASGIGALVGALYLASRKSVLGLGKIIPLAASIFGIGLVALALSRVLLFSMALMLMIGFGMMVQMASSNTVLQTIVDDDKRGRVMSFYAMALRGMVPFGSLLAGSLASKIGAPHTLLIGGSCCILGSLMFAKKLSTLREMIRPIYVRIGVIPEVAKGIQTATEFTAPRED